MEESKSAAEVISFILHIYAHLIPNRSSSKEVVHHTPSLKEVQLVSVCKYESHNGTPTLSPPLAVGRMAVSSDQLADGGREKGKAVIVLHTWKDHLWEMGNKSEPPEDVPIQRNGADAEKADGENGVDATAQITQGMENVSTQDNSSQAVEPSATAPSFSYTPEEVSDFLHKFSVASTCNDIIRPSTLSLPHS
ncbi:hypothetical protein MPER_03958, partial [Moniliophthora perniciosa FA553]